MAGHAFLLFDNASARYLNFTTWTAQQLRSAVNLTKHASSFEEIVWLGPRIIFKLGKFLLPPSFVDTAKGVPQHFEHASVSMTDAAPDAPAIGLESAKGLSSLFSYATSKWALCCVIMAIVLNRTYIFAATRRRLQLLWPVRLLIRAVPIFSLTFQAVRLLQSIQCQTSMDYFDAELRQSNKTMEFAPSRLNAFLHRLTSMLLVSPFDSESCLAVKIVSDGQHQTPQNLRGSLSLLWPLFGTFCLSQFAETLSCSIQGRPMAAETGMTLFEHSLAFSEADAAARNQSGWNVWAKSKVAPTVPSILSSDLTPGIVLGPAQVNTPSEVLLVAFLSVMSHISSHILGIFSLQSRFRLVSTTFWGLCFMVCIMWSALTFSTDSPAVQSLLRFPTVSIIGFVPHILILGGILICFSIYGLALLLSTLATPRTEDPDGLGFFQRLSEAHGNMQSNISLSDIRITMDMDFYTALLRIGFGVITMASEAVYLNEDSPISVKSLTWLEEDRLREIEQIQTQLIAMDSRYDQIGTIGLVPVQGESLKAANGYLRERAAQQVSKVRHGERRLRDGVGASERSARWLMAFDYLMSINKLLAKSFALCSLKMLRSLGISRQPRWLLRLLGHQELAVGSPKLGLGDGQPATETFVTHNGSFLVPRIDQVDVEQELRKRHKDLNDQELDAQLYRWWAAGGWWGTVDGSGNYEATSGGDELDNTSVVSHGTASDDETWESDPDVDTRPTRPPVLDPRDASPGLDISFPMADLARLLDPSSAQEREEAKLLSAHLLSEGIVTRSSYQKSRQLQRTQILGGQTARQSTTIAAVRASKLSDEQESELLEELLLSRRSIAGASGGASWKNGGVGLGREGPQCVVCQSTPRTIIVWPCRCLGLCDDCRVSLAMNNFEKCVCCRREVISFSRMYVP